MKNMKNKIRNEEEQEERESGRKKNPKAEM